MKIKTLLLLSIYSLRLRAPRFLGPHDTLPCVLISVKHWNNKIVLLDAVVLVRVPYSPRVGGNKLDCHNIVSRVGINVRGKGFILDILVE